MLWGSSYWSAVCSCMDHSHLDTVCSCSWRSTSRPDRHRARSDRHLFSTSCADRCFPRTSSYTSFVSRRHPWRGQKSGTNRQVPSAHSMKWHPADLMATLIKLPILSPGQMTSRLVLCPLLTSGTMKSILLLASCLCLLNLTLRCPWQGSGKKWRGSSSWWAQAVDWMDRGNRGQHLPQAQAWGSIDPISASRGAQVDSSPCWFAHREPGLSLLASFLNLNYTNDGNKLYVK